MMPGNMERRNADLRELMDDPTCDRRKLENTYRQFRIVNAALSRTGTVFRRWIEPLMADARRTYTLLDIGFGGGDLPIKLTRWAARRGHALEATAIETDARAFQYAQTLSGESRVTFRHASVRDLVQAGEKFDFVFSNHLLHHLDDRALKDMFADSEQLAAERVVFVDLERSALAYALFSVLSLPFPGSYIRHDGLISLRRSFTGGELACKVPPRWSIHRIAPFRLVAVYDPKRRR